MTATSTLRRSKSRRWVGGVCAGLAEYFAVHPIWLRLVFALWSLSNGLAAGTYVLLWILLPDETSLHMSRPKVVRYSLRDILSEGRRWSQDLRTLWERERPVGPEQARRVMALGGLLAFTGLLFLADSLGLFGPFHLHHLRPIAMILIGAVMLNRALRI